MSTTHSISAITEKREDASNQSRRRYPRYEFMRPVDWDFFTAATGAKVAFLENLSEGGGLLRSSELIEHRRWIRMVVKEPKRKIWFTCVGRIVHREDRMEAWDDSNITLYRYGVEFIHPLNPLVLNQIRENHGCCANCGEPSASISDFNAPNKVYCVLCHLRRACHNLLVDDLDPVS